MSPHPRVAAVGDAIGDLRGKLEAGQVLLAADLAFGVDEAILGTQAVGKIKNISFHPATGALKGAAVEGGPASALADALEKFSGWAEMLVRGLLPAYGDGLAIGKASFRPRPAETAISPRKDDRRLHVDAFPSQPTQGRRILRVFRNVHPAGVGRVWEVGEPFAEYAARFLPRARPMSPAMSLMLHGLGLTKHRRTAYDHLMLQLHDAAKADDAYQSGAPRDTLTFPPGATWLVFTDAVPHAALSGQFALEQTFFLSVEAMADPDASPLAILERMTGRKLA